MISSLACIDLAWSQWQVSTSTPILIDLISLPHLECRWLLSMQHFLRHVHGQLHVHKTFVQPPERLGDIHIMDYAMQCGSFKPANIKIVNYCRLYLHVTTVSELFNAAGTHILPAMLQCRRSPWFDPATYYHPAAAKRFSNQSPMAAPP